LASTLKVWQKLGKTRAANTGLETRIQSFVSVGFYGQRQSWFVSEAVGRSCPRKSAIFLDFFQSTNRLFLDSSKITFLKASRSPLNRYLRPINERKSGSAQRHCSRLLRSLVLTMIRNRHLLPHHERQNLNFPLFHLSHSWHPVVRVLGRLVHHLRQRAHRLRQCNSFAELNLTQHCFDPPRPPNNPEVTMHIHSLFVSGDLEV